MKLKIHQRFCRVMNRLLCNTSISIKSNVDVRVRWWKTVTTCKYWFILAIVNCSTFSLAVEMQDSSRDSLGGNDNTVVDVILDIARRGGGKNSSSQSYFAIFLY